MAAKSASGLVDEVAAVGEDFERRGVGAAFTAAETFEAFGGVGRGAGRLGGHNGGVVGNGRCEGECGGEVGRELGTGAGVASTPCGQGGRVLIAIGGMRNMLPSFKRWRFRNVLTVAKISQKTVWKLQ